MANEITVTISGTLQNNDLNDRVLTKRFNADQSQLEAGKITISCSTTIVNPLVSDTLPSATPGITFIENLSSLYTAYYGCMSNSTLINLFAIKPRERHVVRLDLATWLSTDWGFMTKASTDTPNILLTLWSD